HYRTTAAPRSGQHAAVTSVALSPAATPRASGSADRTNGTVRLWDMAAHQPIGTVINSQAGPVSSVAFSPDDKTLAIGSYDGSVWLWDVATRQSARPVTASSFSVDSVAFSPNGKTPASGRINAHLPL